jgi:hypothetical protein
VDTSDADARAATGGHAIVVATAAWARVASRDRLADGSTGFYRQ